MSKKLIIKNGLVAISGADSFTKCDILIENGIIKALGNNLNAKNIIDADGLQVFPGAIDPHVHFNEPGYTNREDFYHGSCAAASGGVTTVIDMPCTSIPPVTDLANLREKVSVIEKRAVIDFATYGGVSEQCFDFRFENEMSDLAPYVPGFKSYFISGMPSFRRLEYEQFSKVLKAAKNLKRTVLLHAEDYETITYLEAIERTKGNAWENYARSRPAEAEIIAIKNAVHLAEEADARLHIVHVGTSAAAELIAASPNVSGETCPHYLAFTQEDFETQGSLLKTAPVVKTKADAAGLWQALLDGKLDFVASDHAPAPASQKNTGNFWNDYSGIPGTGTFFPYLYSEGLIKRKFPLSRFLKIIAKNAAKRYLLDDRKGSIEAGKDADLIFVNPEASWTVRGAEFYSKGKLTPFEGMRLHGQVEKTLVRGTEVYSREKGILAAPGFGQYILPY
ncbi:MAG TPA: allantoinase AllB [Candidatus Marinimicrobia bacterium]|nr:allantoinase AllB [Candidatus Neomarinimicrobiota bacterium]